MKMYSSENKKALTGNQGLFRIAVSYLGAVSAPSISRMRIKHNRFARFHV